MRLLLTLALLALPAFSAKPAAAVVPAVPEIDAATQIEVLASQFEFALAQSAAAPYVEAAKKAQAATQPSLDKASKQCNPDGAKKYDATYRDKKVLCVLAPPPAKPTASIPNLPAPAPPTADTKK